MSQRRSTRLSRINTLMLHSKSKSASLKSISATKSLKPKSNRKRASTTTSKRAP